MELRVEGHRRNRFQSAVSAYGPHHGQKVIGGRTAAVFANTVSDGGEDPFEDYRTDDASGVTYLGSNDGLMLTAAVSPYPEVVYPLSVGEKFHQFDGQDIDLEEDIDGDGRTERTDVRSDVAAVGFAGVTVAAGTFDHCVVLERTTRYTVRLTSTGEKVVLVETERDWFARDVGLVKMASVLIVEVDGSQQGSSTAELTGYHVTSSAGGHLEAFSLASGVTGIDSDPRILSAASNGASSLAVFCGTVAGETGVFTSFTPNNGGTATTRRQIPLDSCFAARPQTASDGTNYLVTFARPIPAAPNPDNLEIAALRIGPTGEPLDAAGVFSLSPPDRPTRIPSIVFNGSDYVVVYYRGSYNFFDPPREVAVKVSPAGVVSTPIELDVAVEDFPSFPRMATEGGDILLVGTRLAGTGNDVYGVRIDSTLHVVGSVFPISTAVWAQSDPAVAFDGENYLVAWTDHRGEATSSTVHQNLFGTRISKDGALLDGDAATGGIAIDTTPLLMTGVDVLFAGGRYLVVSTTDRPGHAYLRELAPSGAPLAGLSPSSLASELTTQTDSLYIRFGSPVVVDAGDGVFVAWTEQQSPFDPTNMTAVNAFPQ